MSATITGVVTNGVIVPNALLPEGAHVEIQVKPGRPETLVAPATRPRRAWLSLPANRSARRMLGHRPAQDRQGSAAVMDSS
jgi:hypothetical protein